MKCYQKIITLLIALTLLFVFSAAMILKIGGIDSDTLYPFNFAKDILTGVPLSHWFLPGPTFFVPDILFSLPLVALLKTPAYWAIAIAVIQNTALIFLITLMTEKKDRLSFHTRFISALYLQVIAYIIGLMIFHWAWILTAGRIFLAVNHFWVAYLALFIYFLTHPQTIHKRSIPQLTWIILLTFFLCLSDPLFCFYFFCLNLPFLFYEHLRLLKNKRWLWTMVAIALFGCSGVLVDYLINPGLAMELAPHNTSASMSILSNIQAFWTINHWLGVSLLFILPTILIVFSAIQKKKYLLQLLIGALCVSIFSVLFGLLKYDTSTLRYAGIYFPIVIYTLFELIPLSFHRAFTGWIAGIMALIVLAIYPYRKFEDYTHTIFFKDPALKMLVSCHFLQQGLNDTGTALIATYWPAKVVFEIGFRKMSLVQVSPDLRPYRWIYNPNWATMHPKKPKKLWFITYQIDPDKLRSLSGLADASTHCNGQLISVPFNSKLITLAPALTVYSR